MSKIYSKYKGQTGRYRADGSGAVGDKTDPCCETMVIARFYSIIFISISILHGKSKAGILPTGMRGIHRRSRR